MNLADAIRQAAGHGGLPHPMTTQASPTRVAARDDDFCAEEEVTTPILFPEMTAPEAPQLPAGSAVRLELFLSAEQLNAVLRAVMEGQRTVMTMREASHYLRINPHVLEKMAIDKELPAFMIEGRWRFAKPALDEWLTSRSIVHKEEGGHAA